MALSLGGIVPWGIAAAQSLFRKYKACVKTDLTLQENDACVRASTHSTINALLFLTSAANFLVADLRYTATAKADAYSRMIGSSLWLTSAGIFCWVAQTYQRPKETHPESNIQTCGLHSTYYLLGEIGFLSAGIFYHAALWLSQSTTPLKWIGNVCWLLAGMHDTVQAYQQCRNENQSFSRTTFFRNQDEKSIQIIDKNLPYEPPVSSIV